jgi:hypothetical protein
MSNEDTRTSVLHVVSFPPPLLVPTFYFLFDQVDNIMLTFFFVMRIKTSRLYQLVNSKSWTQWTSNILLGLLFLFCGSKVIMLVELKKYFAFLSQFFKIMPLVCFCMLFFCLPIPEFIIAHSFFDKYITSSCPHISCHIFSVTMSFYLLSEIPLFLGNVPVRALQLSALVLMD